MNLSDGPRGLVVAAPRSSSGKTTVTLGLLRALARRGLKAQGLKCGPDYIDPAFHTVASKRPSINLDCWAMPPETLISLAIEATRDADISICEGLMGLFDGVPAPVGRSGSSADLAAELGWPVLLIVDVSGQSQSAAAVVKGCATYDPRIQIAGVVMNRVGSPRHRKLAGEAVSALGIPVLGSLPRSDSIALPERHLGLVQARETTDLESLLERVADLIETNCDIDQLIGLATPMTRRGIEDSIAIAPPGQRIAIGQDSAFSFLYPHIVRSWRSAGAEIVPFSPLADEAPRADCDVCWLPGGYPELHAGRLAAAQVFLEGLRRFATRRRVHGECGGYMVLGRTLKDATGVTHQMADLLDVATSFAVRKMNLGYREVEILADGPLGRAGSRLRGHEFHYATIADAGCDEAFALVRDAYGSEPIRTGSRRGNVTGSFFHVIAAVSQ